MYYYLLEQYSVKDIYFKGNQEGESGWNKLVIPLICVNTVSCEQNATLVKTILNVRQIVIPKQ